VDGTSASQSGIRNLAVIIPCAVFTIFSGIFIAKTGHYISLMLIGTMIAPIGSGLLYTLDVESSTSHWVGYQVIIGVGVGLAFQIPMNIVQAVVAPSDIASATGLILCEPPSDTTDLCIPNDDPVFRTMGGAVWVSAGQSVFTNILVRKLPEHAPGIDVNRVIAAGAIDIDIAFPAKMIPGIIRSYMEGISAAFLVALILACICFVSSLFLPWKPMTELRKRSAAAVSTAP
jgi:hypothetical protein